MAAAKIAISMDRDLLKKLDDLVKQEKFETRSQAIQNAVEEKIMKLGHYRLALECEKLDYKAEQSMADEGFDEDAKEWSEF